MKIQIPKIKWIEGSKVVSYEMGEVKGIDLYDAWDKAIAAGHDSNKQVIWQVY